MYFPETLSIAKKLDAVMSAFPLPDSEEVFFHNQIIIKVLKSKGLEIPDEKVSEILYKFINDGFVRRVEVSNDKRVLGSKFYLTIEGELFREQGGYVQQHLRKNLEIETTKKLNNFSSYGAVAAAIVALIYFLWDVTKFIIEHSNK